MKIHKSFIANILRSVADKLSDNVAPQHPDCESAERFDGPDVSDGCDHDGFPGGCARAGHTPETCPYHAKVSGASRAADYDGLRNVPVQDLMSPHFERLANSLRASVILRRLKEFVDVDQDDKLTDPMDLINAIFPRVRLAYHIKRVEDSSSWDYCKVAAIDYYKRAPRWIPIHESAYHYQVGCVPPLWQGRRGGRDLTLCGEEYSGDYRLTLWKAGDRYYCCYLTPGLVTDEAYMRAIPIADIPLLGVPKEEEVQ